MKSGQIIKEISQLISSVESSDIQKTDKLKLVKVILSIKLRLIEILGKKIVAEAKVMRVASLARKERKTARPSKKHELILQFIKQNSGRVSATKLSEVGIAGRTLRRYISELSASGRVSVEKKGRRHFYSLT